MSPLIAIPVEPLNCSGPVPYEPMVVFCPPLLSYTLVTITSGKMSSLSENAMKYGGFIPVIVCTYLLRVVYS